MTAGIGSHEGFDSIDLEKAENETKHITISVQGMTCTGCEKKLFRALDSLSVTSNVKTSLILSQAEFDIKTTGTVDDTAAVKTVERMTGFTCTKTIISGAHLDVVVSCDAQSLTIKAPPRGITDLSVLGRHTVRVGYRPEIVGARDLLADPFFPSARLASIRYLTAASSRTHVRMTFLSTLGSGLLTIPVLILAWAPLPEHEILYGAISLALATAVQTIITGRFYLSAFKTIFFSHMIEMDFLIVLSTSTAYIYSVIAYIYLVMRRPLQTGDFFETSTLLVTLIMCGRAVSAFARQKAFEAVPIESLQTTKALLLDAENGLEKQIDARLLQYGDTFKVLPDTLVPTNGIILSGETEVDESLITGEATPIVKKPGMSVVPGSLNHSQSIIVRLTHLLEENSLSTISRMVDQAKSSKPKIQQIADGFASRFVPLILVLSILVFIIWLAIGRFVRDQTTSIACIKAMTYAISALIISCPCAVGLAVPMVVVIVGGLAAKHGLILRSSETIEIAKNVSHVIFDKTGTLTKGRLCVETEEYFTNERDVFTSVILGLTVESKHPVSIAIANHLSVLGVQPLRMQDMVSIPGRGFEANQDRMKIRAGSPFWLNVEHTPAVYEVLRAGLTAFCVCVDDELIAAFGLQDEIRQDAIEVVNALRSRSIDVSIVSGDHETAVDAIAGPLDIPFTHIRARCSPADKQAYVQGVMLHLTEEKKKDVVIFVGDGTNDAAALARASIGVHMDEGTEIARNAADAMLLRPQLIGILQMIDLSKAFHRRVVLNFAWAGVYNLFALLLAAGAFPSVRIAPQFAGLGEIVSVVPVVLVAISLKWIKI